MSVRMCQVYWGSHGCDLWRGHEKIGLPHVCFSCFDPTDMDGYVGAPPYCGPETRFYGEDAEPWHMSMLPLSNQERSGS